MTIRDVALGLLAGGLMTVGVGTSTSQIVEAHHSYFACTDDTCNNQPDCGPNCYCNTPNNKCRSNAS